MSKRNKLQRFADNRAFAHVYENFDVHNPQLAGKDGVVVDLKGQWKAKHFNNNNPITLELACGGGEYAISLAQMYPERNFIGVDIKGARIWKGASSAIELGLNNVAFLRTRIEQIAVFFETEEIDEIWITFPDPFLRESKSNRRLTSPNFLKEYKKILKKDGIFQLKTDSPELYEFTMEVLETEKEWVDCVYNDDDIYAKALPLKELEIKTRYEQMHLKNKLTIKYVKMRFK